MVGGKYIASCDVDGATAVYSVLKANEQQVKKQYEDIVQSFEAEGLDFGKKMWFVCPYYGGNFGRFYVRGGYVFGSYEELMMKAAGVSYYEPIYGNYFNEEEIQ